MMWIDHVPDWSSSRLIPIWFDPYPNWSGSVLVQINPDWYGSGLVIQKLHAFCSSSYHFWDRLFCTRNNIFIKVTWPKMKIFRQICFFLFVNRKISSISLLLLPYPRLDLFALFSRSHDQKWKFFPANMFFSFGDPKILSVSR